MNRENLKILSDGLLGLIPSTVPTDFVEFDMGIYHKPFDLLWTQRDVTYCGTAGCAIGWGPFFGIAKLREESFQEYSCRVFDISHSSREWTYMFACLWNRVDNSKEGAGLRIKYVLQNSLPLDWKEQVLGETPLSYK